MTSALSSVDNTKIDVNIVKDSTLQSLKNSLGLVLQGDYKMARNETKALKLHDRMDALDRDLVLKIEALATEERALNQTEAQSRFFRGESSRTKRPAAPSRCEGFVLPTSENGSKIR